MVCDKYIDILNIFQVDMWPDMICVLKKSVLNINYVYIGREK